MCALFFGCQDARFIVKSATILKLGTSVQASLLITPQKKELFDALSKPWVKGITLSGGHPLEPQNSDAVYELLREIKQKFPNKDIWLYTGYHLNWEDFRYPSRICHLLALCDVVVDGPFILEQRDLTLPFRGSRNQRLIDVRQSIEEAHICELKI